MTDGFIKNYDLLREDCKTEDLIDISHITDGFKNKLQSIDKSSIVGLIGQFGSGKSTMLYQIEKNKIEKDDVWINFDAWKYPDRKDMWEGLIIEFAYAIDKRKEIVKKLDGKSDAKKRINTYADIGKAFTGLPVFDSIKSIYKTFHDESPIRRLYEIQLIFKTLIENIKGNLYLVLEDVDRSGDSGLFLLETLKQFLGTLDENKKIIVIVPVGDAEYKKNINAYLKCFDYVEYFNYTNINLDLFFKSVIKNEMLIGIIGEKILISEIFEYVFKVNPEFNIRLMKTILRKANMNYKAQLKDKHSPKWMWTVVFELTKYIYDKNEKESYFDKIIINNNLSSTRYINIFIWSINNQISIYENIREKSILNLPYTLKFIKVEEYNESDGLIDFDIFNNTEENSYGIYDYYLKY